MTGTMRNNMSPIQKWNKFGFKFEAFVILIGY